MNIFLFVPQFVQNDLVKFAFKIVYQQIIINLYLLITSLKRLNFFSAVE